MGKGGKGVKGKGKKNRQQQHAADENPSDTPLFRSIVKAYDDKNYKKGLKACDQMLSMHPNHAETLAMKGIIISCQSRKGKQEEAYDLVRQGLKNNIKSNTCWHVYGLLYKADLNYDEAIKCYKQAVKLDPENLQVLRDLASLQVQQRDLTGYRSTCKTILRLKPKIKFNWITLAVAHKLLGSSAEALKVIQSYLSTVDHVDDPYEDSELRLFANELLEASGEKLESVLKDLGGNGGRILDKTGFRERRAELLLKMGQAEDAEGAYMTLLRHNNECYKYYNVLADLAAAKRHNDPLNAKLDLFSQLQQKHPDSYAAKRLPLDLSQGDGFRDRLLVYVQLFLSKGIPSLFSDLKSLYSDKQKVEIMGEVFEQVEKSLRETSKFPNSTKEEKPVTFQWAIHLRAQHLAYTNNLSPALTLVDEGIALNDKTLELYICKARTLKRMGDLSGAAEAIGVACEADRADRWYNSKTVLYLLRSNQVEKAVEMANRFSLHKGEKRNNLFEMQCIWWATELGHSYQRLGERGKALRQYHNVKSHFADFHEDQFDFHSYCVRKMTVRSYLALVSFEDSLYSHPFFVNAALGACHTYLDLHRNPPEKEKDVDEGEQKKRDDAGEKETKKGGQNKKQNKKGGGNNKNKNNNNDAPSNDDERDPDGKELLAVDNYLEVACKEFLGKLNIFARDWLQTHVLSTQIYLERGKMLLGLRAVKRGMVLMERSKDRKQCPNSQRAQMLVCIHEFWSTYERKKDSVAEHVRVLVDEERGEGLSQKVLDEFVGSELATFSQSVLHNIAGFAINKLKGEKFEGSLKKWIGSKKCGQSMENSTCVDCREAVAWVGRLCPDQQGAIQAVFVEKWPRAQS